MKRLFLATTAVLWIASAQAQTQLAHPSCLAQANAKTKPFITIDDLRRFVEAHPDCDKVPLPPPALPIRSSYANSIDIADCVMRETRRYREQLHIDNQTHGDGLHSSMVTHLVAAVKATCNAQ
jgi:hypothetical protein